MSIVVNLDVMMAVRKVALKDLAERVGITNANLSILKTGKARAIRFSTLEAICRGLVCQPGDILAYDPAARAEPGTSAKPGTSDEPDAPSSDSGA